MTLWQALALFWPLAAICFGILLGKIIRGPRHHTPADQSEALRHRADGGQVDHIHRELSSDA